MRDARLDNPMWYALQGPHRRWAQGQGGLQWFPPDVAPFFALESADIPLVPDLPERLQLASNAYFVGVLPASWPRGWKPAERSEIVQMSYLGATPLWEPAPHVLLGPDDRPAMLALAAIAFPDFFRARSAELGTFIGIYEQGRLVSMAGERMALEGMREISAICTHPEFTGRGYAGGLTRALIRRHRQQGLHSFLHVSAANIGARGLYESLGFAPVAVLPMIRIEPQPA
jgi:ribosomal protein S18 acetylase RimI-like enzyme